MKSSGGFRIKGSRFTVGATPSLLTADALQNASACVHQSGVGWWLLLTWKRFVDVSLGLFEGSSTVSKFTSEWLKMLCQLGSHST